MSESPAVIAGDLALCHPRLRRREVRAVARPIDGSDAVRLTVVAHERPGLIADSAAVLAGHGLSVVEASAGTWSGLALHAFTMQPDRSIDDDGGLPRSRPRTHGQHAIHLGVRVRATRPGDGRGRRRSHRSDDRALARAGHREGPDRAAVGDLSLVRRPRHQHRVGPRSNRAGVACDTFVVIGDCDANELAAHLSRGAGRRRPESH